MIQWSPVAASVIVLTLLLAGCSAAAPEPSPSLSASPSAQPESSVPELTSLADLPDTNWLVDDSQGDRTTVKFNADGSVSYVSDGQSFAYPEDTWSLDGDTVTWQVTYGARFGVWSCTGTFDAATQLITGTWTSTVGESGTLSARRPVR
ncbi:MAG: hypothetical protein Q8M65_09355 [Rhodoglobus sp.]|nr:hypothetical protein [Rhodoglobus sp.]